MLFLLHERNHGNRAKAQMLFFAYLTYVRIRRPANHAHAPMFWASGDIMPYATYKVVWGHYRDFFMNKKKPATASICKVARFKYA